MTDLRDGLDKARGNWPRIAADTGIDYFTIARIARGETERPHFDTVEKIQEWLRDHPPVVDKPSAPQGAAA